MVYLYLHFFKYLHFRVGLAYVIRNLGILTRQPFPEHYQAYQFQYLSSLSILDGE